MKPSKTAVNIMYILLAIIIIVTMLFAFIPRLR